MTTRKRIQAQYAGASGGGSTPTVGNVAWGPDFGEGSGSDGKTFGVGVATDLDALALRGGSNVGVLTRLAALVLPFLSTSSPNVGVQTALSLVSLPFDPAGAQAPKVGVQATLSSLVLPFTSAGSPKSGVQTGLGVVTVGAEANNPQTGIHTAATAQGAPLVQAVSSNFTTTNATSFTVPKPTGTVDGELVIVNVAHAGTEAITASDSGWTQIDQGGSGSGGTSSPRVATFLRVASSDPTNYTFTYTGTASGWSGGALRIIGFDTTTPVNVQAVTAANATDPVAPTITTTAANCLKLAFAAAGNLTNSTEPAPTGYTAAWDVSPTSLGLHANLDHGAAYRAQAAAGASGTATFNSNAILNSAYRALHVAIAPGPFVLAT